MDKETAPDRDLELFFSELGERLEIVANCEAQIATHEAPSFNLFNSKYIAPNENKITAILADLLSPTGSHGQGAIFLEAFLMEIGFRRALDTDVSTAFVRPQHPTNNGRLIDLTVRTGKYILGLENKIDAREEMRQVDDYIEYLRSKPSDDWFFVFLTRYGTDPISCESAKWNGFKGENRARSLSYADLSKWLGSWAILCKSDRVRVMLQDMTKWANGKGENVANDFREGSITEFVLSHKGHIKTCLAVLDDASGLRNSMIKEFAKSLENEIKGALEKNLPGQGWQFTRQISNANLEDPNALYPAIFLTKPSWEAYGKGLDCCQIGIESQTMSVSRFVFGIKWGEPGRDVLKQSLKKALDSNPEMGQDREKIVGPFPWCAKMPGFDGGTVNDWKDSATLSAMHDEARRPSAIDDYVNRILYVARVASGILG
jgi:hypothetical protein